jgi:hypothetical protein
MIKAIVVFLDGKGFEFRNVKGMDIIFNHHQVRYLIAYGMLVMNLFGDELIKIFSKIKENPNMAIKFFEEMKKDDNFFENKMKFYLFRKLVLIRKEFDWFSMLDIMRQDGFYCDYEDQLKNPIKISQDNYFKVIQRLEKVKNFGTILITSFNAQDDLIEEQINNMKRIFRQNGYYQKIEDTLTTIRKTKQSAFNLVKQSFGNDNFKKAIDKNKSIKH